MRLARSISPLGAITRSLARPPSSIIRTEKRTASQVSRIPTSDIKKGLVPRRPPPSRDCRGRRRLRRAPRPIHPQGAARWACHRIFSFASPRMRRRIVGVRRPRGSSSRRASAARRRRDGRRCPLSLFPSMCIAEAMATCMHARWRPPPVAAAPAATVVFSTPPGGDVCHRATAVSRCQTSLRMSRRACGRPIESVARPSSPLVRVGAPS